MLSINIITFFSLFVKNYFLCPLCVVFLLFLLPEIWNIFLIIGDKNEGVRNKTIFIKNASFVRFSLQYMLFLGK